MQHIPKQSHYVRCPALELLCNGLCGPLPKKLETHESNRQSQPSGQGCHLWGLQKIPDNHNQRYRLKELSWWQPRTYVCIGNNSDGIIELRSELFVPVTFERVVPGVVWRNRRHTRLLESATVTCQSDYYRTRSSQVVRSPDRLCLWRFCLRVRCVWDFGNRTSRPSTWQSCNDLGNFCFVGREVYFL